MYEAHFQMHRRPFPPTADVSTYVGIGPVEQAGQTLLRVVQRGSGPSLVIGASGMGKSMLCQLLAEHFEDQMMVAALANGQLANAKALFQAILFELGLPYRDMDENELRLALVELLTDTKRCPQGLLLIVDEAHGLPLRILEEIRMLTNVVQNGQPRVHLVLAGGAALEERFTSPKLDSFNQRLAARCYLESLNREETGKYIQEQVLAAGGNADAAFAGDALSAVYDATDGIPRLINQLCDHALIMASLGGHVSVTPDVVQEAWADLQQLPAPWTEPSTAPAGGQHVIEFGELDDASEPASVPFQPTESVEVAGEVNLPAEPAAEAQLDKIESHIASIDETFEDPKEQVAEALPEPVIAPNPFEEEAFEEELPVEDSYAALQEVRFAHAPRVASTEGRQIAALLAQAPTAETDQAESEVFVTTAPVSETDGFEQLDSQGQETIHEESAEYVDQGRIEQEAADRQAELTQAVASLLKDDDESVVEEVNAEPPTETIEVAEAHPPIQLSLVSSEETHAPEDDRDLIIVEDRDEQTTTPHVGQGKVRRQKYRQLFNRLRQA